MNHCKTCEYFHREWLICFRRRYHIYDYDSCDKWEKRLPKKQSEKDSDKEYKWTG